MIISTLRTYSYSRLQLASVITAASLCSVSVGVYAAPELEEIVVTAQKREQSLQEVPVAISAISGEMLTQTVIKDVFDLQTNVPGLIVDRSQNSTSISFSIRGVGTSSQNFGLESSVGLYVDGAYRSRQSAMINNLVDMQGIEVLRGPQGTLFGKNTPSGAILFKTVAPSHETDGFVEVAAGNYGLLNISGAGSLSAIEDVLAFRLTAFSGERDGIVDVIGKGDNVLNDSDRWGTRLQALYTPSEDLSVRIIADYAEIDERCCAAMTFISNHNITDRRPGPAFGAPGSDTVVEALGGTVFSGNRYFDFKTALNHLPVSENEDQGLSVEVNWEVNEYTLTSVSAYRSFDSLDDIDADFTDLDLVKQKNEAEQRSFSQELRLAYEGDKVKYVVGGYYFDQDIDHISELSNHADLNSYLIRTQGLVPLIAGIDAVSAGSGGLFPPAAEPFPDGYLSINTTEQEHKSWALFAQTDITLSPSTILTLGLRYTDEDKELVSIFDEILPGGASLGPAPNIPAALATLGAGPPYDLSVLLPFTTQGWGYYLLTPEAPRPDIDVSLPDDQVTGTAKISWLMNDDIMFYALYGTGYKSGGTNTDRINAAFGPTFGAEKSRSFEVGMKADFPEQALRINIALHRTDVDDFQALAFSGIGFNLQNAGKLKTYGGEVELGWVPTDTMDISFIYSHSIADFEEFKQGTCWVAFPFHTGNVDPGDSGAGFCDRTGDRNPTNPEDYLTLSIKQEFPLAPSISAFIQGEYSFISEMVLDGNNDPFKRENDFGLLNIRLGIHFDELGMDLTAWGRNVLDEEYKKTTFDTPVQDGKLNAYPGEPATFGLTLNKKF